jgi:excisionase family DNA binding protein
MRFQTFGHFRTECFIPEASPYSPVQAHGWAAMERKMSEPDALYSIKEASRYVGACVTMIYRLANRGEIKMLKVGRRSFISAGEIARYQSRLAVKPATGGPVPSPNKRSRASIGSSERGR